MLSAFNSITWDVSINHFDETVASTISAFKEFVPTFKCGLRFQEQKMKDICRKLNGLRLLPNNKQTSYQL